jgi:hypothetical protein
MIDIVDDNLSDDSCSKKLEGSELEDYIKELNINLNEVVDHFSNRLTPRQRRAKVCMAKKRGVPYVKETDDIMT